ncbi:retention module-containing protein, partial [Billgrantia sp. Q4P2]|uniref:retention module-containing protein n=1 Tax=Billgrantia sp. Q4P2 TaxID=3463857 RepID=UPI0040563012
MVTAKVISITGQAWARDAEGNLRELRVGDTLQEGEVLITSDNGSVQLDFGDGLNPALVEGGEQVVMTPELDAGEAADASEFAALDDDLEALLAALDDDSIDLLDILDATAAGAGPGGAADGGHNFVRLARIAEDVNPLAFEFGLGQASDLPEIEDGALQGAAGGEEASDEAAPLPPGTITVSLGDFNSQNVTQVPLTGTTTNVPMGSIVTLVVTDQQGNTVTTTATVDPEGNYQTEADLSDLVDGPVSVDASVVDQTGGTRTAEDDAVKDTFAEATITIDAITGDDVVNGEEAEQAITITGTVGGDAGEGDTVTLTVGGQTFSGEVVTNDQGELVYAIDVPGELLAENSQVEASVSGSDDAGNPYNAVAERPYQVVPDIVRVGPDGDPAIGNVIVTEGEAAVFKVVLSNASPHSNTYTLELESGTATLGEDFTGEFSFSNGVTYDPSTGLITVPAGVSEFTVAVPTVDDDLVEDTETFTLTVGNVTATGTILDNDVSDAGETVETMEDTPLSGNLLDNAETNVGEASVSGFEVEGVAYVPGQTVVLEGKGALTIHADGSYHFEPHQDYSGPVPQIAYTVTNGLTTVGSTLDINVTPVADTPDVSVTLAESGTLELTLGGPNVNDPQGFSVEAFKNGTAGEISIRSSGSPTGFGVAGPASDGADSEIGNGESLKVALDTPAESVSFQLAWLSSSEYAKYVVHYTDGSSEAFVVSGNSPQGGFDQIGEVITRQAPEGKWIAAIEFATPGEGEANYGSGNDYLVHQVSYVAATTYAVEIVATPTDIDFSESIVSVVVEVPEGTTLSAGERNENGTWTLPLESDGSYTVAVDPVTQEVSITGLVLTVPIDFTDPVTLTVTATAQDGADTAEGEVSVTAPVATITIDIIAGDGVVNGEEAEGDVTITGTVGGDAGEGDTVTLTVGGETFIGTVDADGNYAIDVPGALLADNDSITAEVTGSDDVGNPYRADAERGYGVDLEATATITIDIIAGDGVVNGEEAEGDVTITGTVGGDAGEGDTVTLTVGGETFIGTVDADGNYAIDVPGSLLAEHDSVTAEVTGSDDAGNPYRADAERGYGVDLEATATITIDIIAGDGVVNGEEAEGDVTITGTVGGDAGEGDTVTLTVGGETFIGTVDADGNYAIDVPGALLAEHDSVTAEVIGSDAAGNPYRADAERDYSVNLSGEAEISIDPIAGDGV